MGHCAEYSFVTKQLSDVWRDETHDACDVNSGSRRRDFEIEFTLDTPRLDPCNNKSKGGAGLGVSVCCAPATDVYRDALCDALSVNAGSGSPVLRLPGELEVSAATSSGLHYAPQHTKIVSFQRPDEGNSFRPNRFHTAEETDRKARGEKMFHCQNANHRTGCGGGCSI